MEAIPNRVIELVEIRPGRRICVERAWPAGVQALHAAVPRADSAGEVDAPPSGSSIDAKHGDVGTQSSSRLALVFIHGSLARRTQFEAQFEAFRHTHPCVRYDFLGCGDSDKPDVWDAYAEEETVADAVEVVRRYAGAQCVLVGHSFGSNVAAQLAVHPDLQPIVRGVVG
ncbi:alpha/beta fold hydrolase, partial [archaeon]